MSEKLPHLKGLNSRQLKAVTYGLENGIAKPANPLLIIAGAGTGKTKTLSARATHLIISGARPDELMIAAFTRKASEELVGRIRGSIKAATGVSIDLPYAGTFHSVAMTVIREFARELKLKRNFTVLGRDEAADLLDIVRTRKGFGTGKKLFPQKDACLAIYSYSTNACLSLEATLRRKFPAYQKTAKQLSSLFEAYELAKRDQNVLDYDDLLAHFAELLRKPAVRDQLRKRFAHVLVDEYQDTNRLQVRILHRLKPDGRGLTVVGDDAQAIYSFRAATVKNIRRFPNRFTRPAKVIRLRRNYRSTQPILDASNAVIALSEEAFRKDLQSKRQSDQRPYLTTVEDEQKQAEYVAQTALRLREEGIPFSDQAVLFRASHHSAALELALERAKIPYRKWGGLKFLESAHIRDMIALLQWWHNPRNQIAGFRVICLLPGIGKSNADRLLQEISPEDYKSLKKAKVPAGARNDWAGLAELLRRLKQLKSQWPIVTSEIAGWYRPHLKRLYEDNAELRLADLGQFEALAGTFGSCEELLSQIALDPPASLASQGLSHGDDEDLLTLSTIHSAKGHEWGCVTLLSAVDGCLPSSRSPSQEDIEEERRLLYVAMTRAKDRLEIIVPRRVFQLRRSVPVVDFYSRPTRFIPKRMCRLFECRVGKPLPPPLKQAS